MKKKKAKARKPTSKSKQLIQFLNDYAATTGKKTLNAYQAAQRALANGYVPEPADIRKKLARDMARAMREDYIEDDDGGPVRHRLAYKVTMGDEQLRLWVNIEDATRNQVRLCAQQRRRGVLSDCEQLNRDLKYYNVKYNPGDALEVSFDFTKDVLEKGEDKEYADEPPEDDTVEE